MIRRITAAALCVGVLGGAAATAEAAFKSGVYRGKTAQQAKISLKVISSKKAVVNFYWQGVRMTCSDGEDRTMRGFKSPSSVRIPLSRSGRFSLSVPSRDGAVEFAAVGRIRNSKATGALQVQARANEQEELDANGSIVCDSEIVAWTAKRKAPKRRR